MRTRERNEKKCKNCNELIPNRNTYCDNKCQAEFQNKAKYEKLQDGQIEGLGNLDSVARTAKRYLIKLHGNKCMVCGWDEVNPFTGKVPVELNHKDGNPENNSIDNLEILCPNHHSLSEFHKSRGKGRAWRKKA
jgi:predicted restriction endonuclease